MLSIGRRFAMTTIKNLGKFRLCHFSKLIPVTLPDLGEAMKEAKVLKWYKKVGDKVEDEEKIVEVETDKATTDLPAPNKGKITKLYYNEGDVCLVGKVLCDIESEESSTKVTSDAIQVAEKEVQVKENRNKNKDSFVPRDLSSHEEDTTFSAYKTSPAVRHLIKREGIKVGDITPTGKDGRILREDVLNFLEAKRSPHVMTTRMEHESSHKITEVPQPAIEPLKDDKVIRLTGIQKAMTKSMTQSIQIPSFLYTDEFNVEKLVKIRNEMNRIKGDGIKMTYMPFFIKAVSLALQQYPSLNSMVSPKKDSEGYICEYIIKKDHNISVAIDSPEGLVVPNIKKVQEKTLLQIQKELYELKAKAENRKISVNDIKDGTFTISNIGNIGGKVLSPVVMPPQVCIIGISKIFDSITVVGRDEKDGEYHDHQVYHNLDDKNMTILFHKSVNLCISADHRVLDGATIARFSETLKKYIENPLKIWTAS